MKRDYIEPQSSRTTTELKADRARDVLEDPIFQEQGGRTHIPDVAGMNECAPMRVTYGRKRTGLNKII